MFLKQRKRMKLRKRLLMKLDSEEYEIMCLMFITCSCAHCSYKYDKFLSPIEDREELYDYLQMVRDNAEVYLSDLK